MDKLGRYVKPRSKTPEEEAAEVQQRTLAILRNLRKQQPGAPVEGAPIEADMEELSEEELALKRTLGLS